MAFSGKFNEVAFAIDPGVYALKTQKAFPAFKKIDTAVADAHNHAGDL